MAELRTEALVLRLVDTGESDRILALYTQQLGRLDVIARGARRSFKRFGGHLGLYTRIEATVDHRPTRGLQPLRSARLLEAHTGLQADLTAFAVASYLAEIVLKATHPDQPDEALWGLLCGAVEAASGWGAAAAASPGAAGGADAVPLEGLVHVAEAGILEALGVLPPLDVCSRCAEPIGASTAGAWVASGADGLFCERCRPLDRRSEHVAGAALAWLQQGVASGAVPPLSSEVVHGCRPLVYEGICHLVGGRPRSLDFLVEMLGV